MLAPLLDRDGWDVVGAVAAQPRGGGWPVYPWSLAALVLLLVAGTQAVRTLGVAGGAGGQALGRYTAAGGLPGAAVLARVRPAGRAAPEARRSGSRLALSE